MNRIGLALSGGGFRASLYHLGLVRFLRDAGILSRVTHITSVSGGSILAAHLVLNWDRYNGAPSEFEAAAAEILAFVRLDVRNRIVRRFPLTLPLRWPRRLLGRSNRKLTRTGLLAYHYEKYLYGDVSLFELPEKPQLHILATNLSEGCLCSFNRNGLLVVRPQPGYLAAHLVLNTIRLDPIHIGLATVPMAVTASSAFPAFFPPLELTGADVGASVGEFGRQAYTDGGVFDNLGVRMFRCLERPLLADSPLTRDDFVDFPAALGALRLASKSSEESPLRRLTQVLEAACRHPDLLRLTSKGASDGPGLQSSTRPGPAGSLPQLPAPPGTWDGDNEELLLSSLCEVLRHYHLQGDPLFAGVKPVDLDAAALLYASRLRGRVLNASDQYWLNRHLLEAAYRQATGQACFCRLDSGLDGVLVSDVGKRIEVQSNRRASGLIRTTLRATDILMDRVWQLEKDTFHDTPGFVFAPITEVVEPGEDPTALHPEIQRQLAKIRTDLDRFSLLEISSLVRHGYCVGRKACRTRPDVFGPDVPANGPWDPVPTPRGAAPSAPHRLSLRLLGKGLKGEPAAATVEARTLQASAFRRIWSTLLDHRDWTSYIYVLLLVPILILVPYVLVKSYERSQRINHLVESLSQGSRDLGVMTRLLEGPMKPWTGEAAEDVPRLDEPEYKGFAFVQDSRIIDMRPWNPVGSGKSDTRSLVYGYRRLKILKQPENAGNNIFRLDLLTTSPGAQIRFPPQQLQPVLRRSNLENTSSGDKQCRWQASIDFSKVPAGDFVDLIYEHYSPGEFLVRGEGSTALTFHVHANTAEVTRWFLMPEGKEYRNFRIIGYETGKPDKVEPVKIVTEYLADDSTILAYKLLSVKAGYTHEIQWSYK